MGEFKEDLRSEELADRMQGQTPPHPSALGLTPSPQGEGLTAGSSSGQPESRGPSQVTRVLRTAANGMQVWIPVDRLESWEKAQAAQKAGQQSAEARARKSALQSAIMSRLRELSGGAQET